jgi:anti-anti-sigma factor
LGQQRERFAIDASDQQVRVSGEVDLAAAPSLEAALRTALSAGTSVDLDLAEVTFIDSAGLHAIVRCAVELNGRQRIRLLRTPQRVARILQLVGMQEIAQIEMDGAS